MPLKSCNVAAGLILSRSSVWLKHPRAPSTFRHGIFERFVFFVDFSMMLGSDKGESYKVTTWWFQACPLKLHLARSGKHYGKHTAEDLYQLVMEAPIKETQSEVWMEAETRHVDLVNLQGQALYAEFADGDYKRGAEDAVPEGPEGEGEAARAFRRGDGNISPEIRDIIFQASLAAAQKALELAPGTGASCYNAGAVTSQTMAKVSKDGAAYVNEDTAMVSRQLLRWSDAKPTPF